jgi:vancomycin resistance protein VanJ
MVRSSKDPFSFFGGRRSAAGGRRTGPLNITCTCGRTISVAAEHRGKRIRCRHCGRELRVLAGPRLPVRLDAALVLLSYAYVAAICVLTLAIWGVGDVWWPATVLLFMGRWIFLVPLIVLLPAASVYRRRFVVPLMLAAAVCVGPFMGARLGWRGLLQHPAGPDVRVVTYNTDGGDAMATRLPAMLAEWRPDFVALQECGDSLANAVARLPGWFHHHVRQLCFLSRYPLLDSMVMDRRAFEQVKESDEGIGGSGDVVRYRVRMPQGIVYFTNLHLETPRKGLESLRYGSFSASKLADNTELRQIESDLASKWVRGGAGPSIVAGDFNTPVESRIFQDSWGSFTDAFSRVGVGFGMTKRNGWISVRIDHVLTGEGWYADHVEIGPDLGSDHLPLIVDLTLVPAPAR